MDNFHKLKYSIKILQSENMQYRPRIKKIAEYIIVCYKNQQDFFNNIFRIEISSWKNSRIHNECIWWNYSLPYLWILYRNVVNFKHTGQYSMKALPHIQSVHSLGHNVISVEQHFIIDNPLMFLTYIKLLSFQRVYDQVRLGT